MMGIGDTVTVNDTCQEEVYVGWEGILTEQIGNHWNVKFEQISVPLPFMASDLDLVASVTAQLA